MRVVVLRRSFGGVLSLFRSFGLETAVVGGSVWRPATTQLTGSAGIKWVNHFAVEQVIRSLQRVHEHGFVADTKCVEERRANVGGRP